MHFIASEAKCEACAGVRDSFGVWAVIAGLQVRTSSSNKISLIIIQNSVRTPLTGLIIVIKPKCTPEACVPT
jgi:hypothetical protein